MYSVVGCLTGDSSHLNLLGRKEQRGCVWKLSSLGRIVLLERRGKRVYVKREKAEHQSSRWYQVRMCKSLEKPYITFEGKKLYLHCIEGVKE